MKKIISFLLCLIFLPAAAAAKTVISGLTWETAPRTEGKAVASPVYSEATELKIKGFNFDRLRTVISLNNSAEKKEMGLVLRYSFRLQIKNEETVISVPVIIVLSTENDLLFDHGGSAAEHKLFIIRPVFGK